jgi:hypothetical protein
MIKIIFKLKLTIVAKGSIIVKNNIKPNEVNGGIV